MQQSSVGQQMNKSLVETAINPINNHGELAVEISNVPKASGYIMLYSEVPALADFKE